MIRLYLFLSAVLSLHAQQILTTYAGTEWLFPSNGKHIRDAALSLYGGLTTDPQGRLVIFDRYNHVVERVEADGTITVIAGNGVPGFSGDGGDALRASLHQPSTGIYDGAGNLLIADLLNRRIRRVTPQGIITTIAGTGSIVTGGDGGPAVRAALSPWDLALGPDGSVFVADDVANRVRRIAPDGTISAFAGTGAVDFSGEGKPALDSSFVPSSIAMEPGGTLLIGDGTNYRIYRVGLDNILTVVAGTGTFGFAGDGGQARLARITNADDIFVAPDRVIYFVDTSNYRLRRITPDGVIQAIAGNGQIPATNSGGAALQTPIGPPSSLTRTNSGALFFRDPFNARLWQLAPDFSRVDHVGGNGTFKGIIDGSPALLAPLSKPRGMALAPDGTLYFANEEANQVLKVAPDGKVFRVAGVGNYGCCGDGGQATRASLRFPRGVAIDPQGRVVFTDSGNNRVRRIDSAGVITTIAGTGGAGFSGDGGPATQAQLNRPNGILIDAAGTIYVSEFAGNRVRRITADGVISTYAGNGTAGFSGDGGPAMAAALNWPEGLAFSNAGELLIADARNQRIRAVSAAGVIRTWAGDGVASETGLRSFWYPAWLAADAQGNVYVTQDGSGITKLVTANGAAISIFAGRSGYGFSGDGGAPANALFKRPGGLAVDRAGNVFIADAESDRVRVVRNVSVSTTLSPAAITLTAIAGSSASAPERVNIASTVAGLRFTPTVTYADGRTGWLNVTSSNEAAPATLTLTANASNLPAGRYTATVNVRTDPAGTSNPVSVTLTVSDSPARLSLSSSLLYFNRTAGAAPEAITMDVKNDGGGSLTYSVTAAVTGNTRWLSITPSTGTLQAGQTGSWTITANPATLGPGTYQGSLLITAGAQRITVPVSLTVKGARGSLLLSQVGLTYTAVAGGGAPLPQPVGILNIGQGVLNWRATTRAPWIRLNPALGTVRQPYLEVSPLEISVVPGSMAAGQYFEQVTITADADNSPQLITVVMNILPEGSVPGPEVTPTGMIFISREGEDPGSQTIRVNHISRGNATYESGRVGDWYKVSPGNGRVAPNTPGSIIVQPELVGRTAGVRRGVVTLQVQEDGSVRTVNLLSVIAPAGAGDSKDGRGAFSCASDRLQVQYTSLREGFVARVGEGMTVEVKVADECGNLLLATTGSPSAQVKATPQNGDSDITLVHMGDGVWRGTWKPVRPVASTRLAVKAILSGSGSGGVRFQTGTAELSGAVVNQTGTQSPLLTAGGVVHAASLTGGVPVAPGSLVTLFGANMAEGTTQAQGLPLPENLNGTQVQLGDRSLPILYASDRQLNAQIPYDVPVDTQFQITVKRNGAIAVPETLTIAAAQPGIFTKSQTGSGQGAIVRQDGVTLAEPGRAATRGEVVIIYCSGLGPVNPPVQSGRPAPSSPLSVVTNPVAVTIGGQTAEVLFAGLSPGYSGLYQINARVPANAPLGDAVEVFIQSAGQRSSTVTMAIR